MRFSDGLARLRQLLQDVTTTHWSEAELAAYLNRHVVSLTRKMTEIDEGYHNCRITLLAANSRQVKSDEFEYSTPPWVMKVRDLRELTDPTSPPAGSRGMALPYAPKSGIGWVWRGMNTVAVVALGATAKDYEAFCAKRPAKLTKGTLPTQNLIDTSHMRLDTDTSAVALLYPHETQTDSYINTIIEITGNNARSGQTRRVTGSAHFVDEAGTRYTVLTLEAPWSTQPLAGDTYDMHFEIPEEHMNLVLLLAANTAWSTRGNVDEQKAMSPELVTEMREFESHIRPRQLAQPIYLRSTAMPSLGLTAQRTEDTQQPLWQ